MNKIKKCKVCGRECKNLNLGMCTKHYNQYKKYGYCLDTNPRTKRDPNEIIIYNDYAEIILYDEYCKEKCRTLIDLDDVEKVKNYKWTFDGRYVRSSNKKIKLHRFVIDAPKNKIIDHINHNVLDNRKNNLRICTQNDNAKNKSKQINNTSGVTGVSWYKKYEKWRVRIQVNNKDILIGYFNDKEDAIKVRKQAEIKYFGEFRNKLND